MAIYIASLIQLLAPSLISKPGKETKIQSLYGTNIYNQFRHWNYVCQYLVIIYPKMDEIIDVLML